MAFWNRKKKKTERPVAVTHVINNYAPSSRSINQEPVWSNTYVPPVTPLFDGVDAASSDCTPSESYTSSDSGSCDSGSFDGGSSGGSD